MIGHYWMRPDNSCWFCIPPTDNVLSLSSTLYLTVPDCICVVPMSVVTRIVKCTGHVHVCRIWVLNLIQEHEAQCFVLSLGPCDSGYFFVGIVPSTKQRSRIGSPSFQHHLMSLNSGLLCKICGSIWRLCLLGVTLPKTFHRYNLCFISFYSLFY